MTTRCVTILTRRVKIDTQCTFSITTNLYCCAYFKKNVAHTLGENVWPAASSTCPDLSTTRRMEPLYMSILALLRVTYAPGCAFSAVCACMYVCMYVCMCFCVCLYVGLIRGMHKLK